MEHFSGSNAIPYEENKRSSILTIPWKDILQGNDLYLVFLFSISLTLAVFVFCYIR